MEKQDSNKRNVEIEIPRRQIIIRLLRMMKEFRGTMFIAIFFGIMNHLSNIALITWGAWLISSIFISSVFNPTAFDISLLFIFGVIKAISSYLEQNKNHDVAFRALANIRTNFFKKLEPLAPAKLVDKHSGDITATIGGDIELIEVFFAHTISPTIIASVVSVVVLTFLGLWWYIFPLILLPFQVTLALIIPLVWERFIRNNGQQIQGILGETSAHLTDSLQGLRTILLFNYGQKRKRAIMNKGLKLNKAKNKHSSYEGFIYGLINLVIFSVDVVVVVVAVYGFISGNLSIQGLIIVITTVVSSFGPLLAMSSVSHHLTRTFAAAERLFNLIDRIPEVNDVPNCSSKLPSRFDIEFKNINFRYSEDNPYVLKNFGLRIPERSFIALIGESGCGKSTVLRLLHRLWNFNSGEITIGGVNIKNQCQKDVFKLIALVPQTPYLFNTTIKENIIIGDTQANMAKIIRCAKMANIHDFITTLPKGYDTEVGELGEKLSGGELQRLLICRALLKDSPILLLDEPTSYLDRLNENAVQITLNKIAKEKTVILITHKLSILACLDKVYHFEDCNNGKTFENLK